MTDVLISGKITAVSPINISKPDADPKERGVPHMQVMEGGMSNRVPVIPGNTFRGMLRSHCATLAARSIGRPLSLAEFNLLYKGGIKGSDKEEIGDVIRSVAFRKSNPLLGLFGSSAPIWINGRVSVGSAMPAEFDSVATTSLGGARRDEIRLNPEILDGMEETERGSYIEYVTVMREVSSLKAQIESIERTTRRVMAKAIASEDKAQQREAKSTQNDNKKEIAALEAKLKAARNSEHYANAIGRPLDPILAIAPGSVFSQRITADGLFDDEAGLLLEALKSLSKDCRIGGKASIGFGLFKADWSIMVRPGKEADWKNCATLHIDPDTCEFNPMHPFAETAEKAWHERASKENGLCVREFLTKNKEK